jgi:hypothetical protein
MAEQILALFCNPPIAVARLGGSQTALDAYHWSQPANPRTDGETVIVPAWSLEVLTDGRVEPYMPADIRLRDGDLIRPVCPFVEVWAKLGEPGSAQDSWRAAPLTPALLASAGSTVADLKFTVTARNMKAARRTQNGDLQFGTFPPIEVTGDDNVAKPVLGVSPPGTAVPMIPVGRSIPLGRFQVMRSEPQPATGAAPWTAEVNVEVIRIRYTPAAGLFYGPPEAAGTAQADPAIPAVGQAQAFLDAAAGWYRPADPLYQFVSPGDTVDLATGGGNVSLGVVDDTCELRVDVSLSMGGNTLETHANLFVSPPDFAPDRRPFLSIADELNDRSSGADDRDNAMAPGELDDWVADLFERVYEHVSLMNVDTWRASRGINPLDATKLATTPIAQDGVGPPTQAMGSRDALRNRTLRVASSTAGDPLPLSNHARERHRTLSDADFLRRFVLDNPGRIEALVRGPFEVEPGEGGNTTSMRMPPFMRNSNALPLTLSAWQHSLLSRWVADTMAGGGPAILGVDFGPSAEQMRIEQAADSYREQVLSRLDAEEAGIAR